MAKITLTVDEATAAFIESGFAFTMYNGRSEVQQRRQRAYEDWSQAFRAGVWSNDDEEDE